MEQPSRNAVLKPHVIKPTHDKPWSSVTRLAPVTDEFYFYDDSLVILSPFDVIWEAPVLARSLRTLEEQVELIRTHQIEKVFVVAEDISFLRDCPSIRTLRIIPAYSAQTFDCAPLYDLPNLQELEIQTVYGEKDSRVAEVDYSRLPKLKRVTVCGAKGHKNLTCAKGLEMLSLGEGQPVGKTLTGLDVSALEELELCRSTVRSLEGIEDAAKLRNIRLLHCRALENLTALGNVGESLTSLELDSCGKVKDFSWLCQLTKLEHLVLCGSNTLPNLQFLEHMPRLKSFRFTVNVLDGDLSLCKGVPDVYCKNRKHYNLKHEELPKGNR